jgi:hypothetical protein
VRTHIPAAVAACHPLITRSGHYLIRQWAAGGKEELTLFPSSPLMSRTVVTVQRPSGRAVTFVIAHTVPDTDMTIYELVVLLRDCRPLRRATFSHDALRLIDEIPGNLTMRQAGMDPAAITLTAEYPAPRGARTFPIRTALRPRAHLKAPPVRDRVVSPLQ